MKQQIEDIETTIQTYRDALASAKREVKIVKECLAVLRKHKRIIKKEKQLYDGLCKVKM